MATGSRQNDLRVRRVVQLLNQDPSHLCPELAHTSQISASRLSHLFRDAIGTNVKNYRLDCPLQLAAHMLESTETPIKVVAYSVGYKHCSSFVRAFKIRYGASPVSYRKLRQAA